MTLKGEKIPEDVAKIVKAWQFKKELEQKPRPNQNAAVYGIIREYDKLKNPK